MPSQQQTLDQQRARAAWESVQEVKKHSDYREKYGPVAKKLPMYVLTNGLGQALAFLRAKANPKDPNKPKPENKANEAAYKHLSAWVMEQMKQDGSLLEWLLKQNAATYRRATAEALAYLNWLKRFAEAEPELKADAPGED